MKHAIDAKTMARIAGGRTDLVFGVLADGHSPLATDSHGVSLLQWAAHYGDVSAVRFLLLHGASLDSLDEANGLFGASYHGHWQLCQFLIESGADPNFRQAETGETPLHAALCKANRPAYDLVLEVLLAAGADPNCRTAHNIPTGSFMRDSRTKGETPLHRAAAFGSETAIRLLLDAGSAIDAEDMHGESPLAWASWHLRPDAVLRLLCHGRHSIHPDRNSTYDHGAGWEFLCTGRPHVR